MCNAIKFISFAIILNFSEIFLLNFKGEVFSDLNNLYSTDSANNVLSSLIMIRLVAFDVNNFADIHCFTLLKRDLFEGLKADDLAISFFFTTNYCMLADLKNCGYS